MTTNVYYLPEGPWETTDGTPILPRAIPVPDGFTPLGVAQRFLDTPLTTVVSCRAGILAAICDSYDPGFPVVVALDFGLTIPGTKVNYRAWALTGHSPIVGPAIVIPDGDGVWPDGAEELVSGPLPRWAIEPMLAARDSGQFDDPALTGKW